MAVAKSKQKCTRNANLIAAAKNREETTTKKKSNPRIKKKIKKGKKVKRDFCVASFRSFFFLFNRFWVSFLAGCFNFEAADEKRKVSSEDLKPLGATLRVDRPFGPVKNQIFK